MVPNNMGYYTRLFLICQAERRDFLSSAFIFFLAVGTIKKENESGDELKNPGGAENEDRGNVPDEISDKQIGKGASAHCDAESQGGIAGDHLIVYDLRDPARNSVVHKSHAGTGEKIEDYECGAFSAEHHWGKK